MQAWMVGTKGPQIERWQTFITGQGFGVGATGVFDDATAAATKKYQKARGLKDDGSVGNMTLGRAMAEGFALIVDKSDSDDKRSQFYPPRPQELKVPSGAMREKMFGTVPYKAAPARGNPEAVAIPDSWVKTNIVRVQTP